MIAAAAALLSGCAASYLNDDVEGKIASDGAPIKQTVTESVTRTSADPSALASQQSAAPSTADAKPASLVPPNTKATQTVAAIAEVGTPGSSAYKIGPQDVLEVTVFKVPELSKVAQVSEAGTFTYPLVGDVTAAGRTPQQVEKDLTKLLGSKYLQNPQVSIYVKEFNSQRVTVDGAVKKPGVFPIKGNLSLLQAVALAQGLEDLADNTVVIFRNSNGKRKAARFDVADIRGGSAEDPELQAGDVVVAGKSALKEGWGNFLKAVPMAGLFAVL